MQECVCCYKCCLCASHEIIPQKGNGSFIINEGSGESLVLQVKRQVPRAKLPGAAHEQGNARKCALRTLCCLSCLQARHMQSCLSWLG